MIGTSSGPMAIPKAAATSSMSSAKSTNAMFGNFQTGSMPAAIGFVVLIGLYLVWALIQQHQRIREQVQPKTVALNFHNLFAVGLMVIVALGMVKLLLSVLVKFNIPGATSLASAVEFAS